MKVGITGHQNLDDKVKAWVSHEFLELVRNGRITYGLTSLAKGADQLFAQQLHEHEIPYTAVIPCSNYLETFKTPLEKDNYNNLLAVSNAQEVLAYAEPTKEAFFAAGKRVVILSELIVAVWNGLPAKGLGGTADVVTFSLQFGRDVLHLNTTNLRQLYLKAKGNQ